MRRISIDAEQMKQLHDNGELELEDGTVITFAQNEMNTTASAGGSYMTPNAFSKNKDSYKKKVPKDYDKVKTEYVEGLTRQVLNRISEITYTDFKNDDTSTNKQKINRSIANISNQMLQIEQSLKRITRLKTEIGADSSVYLSDTLKRFNKISQRILRIGNYIRELNK